MDREGGWKIGRGGAWLLLLAAAALPRLLGLGREGLWLDEAYTVLLTKHSFGDILARLTSDDAPPLFYFLEKMVLAVLGTSEISARILPLAAGIGACLLAGRITQSYLPRAGRAGYYVFAASSLAVFYSRQARSYSFLHLLCLWLLGSTLQLLDRPSTRRSVLFVLPALALLFAHNLGFLLVLPAVGLSLLHLLRREDGRRSAIVLAGLLLAGAIPWGLRLRTQMGAHAVQNLWMGTWWAAHHLGLAPFYSLAAFANGAGPWLRLAVRLPGFAASLSWLRWPIWGAVTVAFLGFFGRLITGPRKDRSEDGREQRQATVSERTVLTALLLFTLFPLVGLAGISWVVGPAYVIGRTDTLALPGFLLILAAGWSYSGSLRRAGIAAWTVAGFLALLPMWTAGAGIEKGADRALAGRLSGEIREGDALVFGHLTRPTMEYYCKRLGSWPRLAWTGSFPAIMDENPAGLIPTPLDSAAAFQKEARTLRRLWEEKGIRRVWLMMLRDTAAGTRLPGPPWPDLPSLPPAERRLTDASLLAFPQNLLLGSLAGLRDVEVRWEYRQDWVGGDRLVLCLPRERWAPVDSLPQIAIQR